MAKQLGRKITLSRGATPEPIANIRTKSISVNREHADVSDDDSSGWREYITSEPSQMSVSISAEGVFSDQGVIERALNQTLGGETYVLEYQDGGKVEGTFVLTATENEAEYNSVATYSISLESSGEISYTAAA